MNLLTLTRAYHFAARLHVDQRRKGVNAEPFINHLTEVADLIARATEGAEPDLVVAAILHDVVEDTPVTIDQVAAEFGEEVSEVVAQVTDDKSLPKAERKRLQIEHASGLTRGAAMIKLADKTSNLRSIAFSPPAGWSLERKVEYLTWAREVVAKCRGADLFLEVEFDCAADALQTALVEEGYVPPRPTIAKAYDVYERDGAAFRGPRGWLFVNEVQAPGGGWVSYSGDRRKPAAFGNLVGAMFVDENGEEVEIDPAQRP